MPLPTTVAAPVTPRAKPGASSLPCLPLGRRSSCCEPGRTPCASANVVSRTTIDNATHFTCFGIVLDFPREGFGRGTLLAGSALFSGNNDAPVLSQGCGVPEFYFSRTLRHQSGIWR